MTKNARVTVSSASNTLTLGGAISGAYGITFYGPGTLELGGASTFTGPIVMNGGIGGSQSGQGTLMLDSVTNGGVAGPLGGGSTSPANLVLNGTLKYNGPAGGSTNRGFTTVGPVSLDSGAGNITVSGQIVAVGVNSLTKKGTGTWTLANPGTDAFNNTDVTVENGTLAFNGGASSVYNLTDASGNLHSLFIGDTNTPVNYGTTTAGVLIQSGSVVVAQTYVGHSMANAQTGLTITGGTLTTNELYGGDNQNSSFSGTQAINLSGTGRIRATDIIEIGSSGSANTQWSMTGNSTIESTYQINIGVLGNASGVMSGNASITIDNNFVDFAPNVGTADLTMTQNSKFIGPAGAPFDIGTGNNTSAGFTGGAQGVIYLQDNALIQAGQLFVGRWNYGAGAVIQTGGTMASSGGNPTWIIGGTDGNANPMGYYQMTAGTFNSGLSALCISDSGVGIWDQTGGNATVYQNAYVANSTTGVGVMNVSGSGVFTVGQTTNWGQGLFVGNQGYGVLNIGTGGTVNTGLGDTWLTNSSSTTSAATGIVNLGTTAAPGGLLITDALWSGGAGTLGNIGILNFHGGTLQATQNEGTFMANLTHAYIFAEGATINAAGFSVSVEQPLEAPPTTGVGVASIAVANGGAGYIGTPVVKISGGHGTGATAVAVMSGDSVSSITITNPGTGYVSGDSLSVSILGVGALSAASAGTVILDSGDASGGLNIVGGGIVTLAAVNTYTGPTTVTGTTLALASGGSIASSPTITLASGGVLDLTQLTSYNFGSQTLAGNGTVNIGAGKTITFVGGTLAPGASIGTLAITGNVDLTGGVAAFELGTSAGSSHASPGLSDYSAITGNLTLAGGLNLIDNAGHNAQGSAGYGYYKLFSYTGTGSGSFASVTGWTPPATANGNHVAVDNVAGDKAVYLDVTQLAGPGIPLSPINLGNVHEGTLPSPATLSVTNTTPAGSFVDTLGATWGAPPVGFVLNGSVSGLGGSQTDNVSMTVGLDPSAVGAVSGVATVSFTSTNAYGLVAAPSVTSAPVSISANVYKYAGAGPITPASVPLGNVHVGDTFAPQSVAVTNTTADTGGFSESLYADTGSTNNTFGPGVTDALSVPFSGGTAVPGPATVNTPVVFTSLAVPGSGLSNTYGPTSGRANLQTQTVTGTGGVYAYASASTLVPSVNLGNVHVGGNFNGQPVAISNTTTDPYGNSYSESLQAASGCSNVVIPPGGSDTLIVCLNGNTGTAGPVSVPVPVVFTSIAVPVSGLSNTYGPTSGIAGLQTQNVTCTGTVWNLAAPAAIASPGYVGRVFAGTPVSSVVTVANLAPAAYSEGLDSKFGTPTGDIGVSGGPVLNQQPSGSADSTMSVSLNTASAGAKSGSVAVWQRSNGTNSSLGNTGLGSQPVSMSGDVFDHGVASFDGSSVVDTLHLVLTGTQGLPTSQSYDIYNLMQTAGFTGDLVVTGWDLPVGPIPVDPGLSTATIAAGGYQPFTAILDTSVPNVFPTETVTIHITDADGIGGAKVSQTLVLSIDATVVPEPSTLALLAVALLGIAAYVRRRK
jgi:autotransporter-associated beta strand protein